MLSATTFCIFVREFSPFGLHEIRAEEDIWAIGDGVQGLGASSVRLTLVPTYHTRSTNDEVVAATLAPTLFKEAGWRVGERCGVFSRDCA